MSRAMAWDVSLTFAWACSPPSMMVSVTRPFRYEGRRTMSSFWAWYPVTVVSLSWWATQRSAGWKPRRRRLLPTTKTEEKAMAAPAIIGLSRPAAASGRAATL